VLLAQLDRAFDYESKGREFESLRARLFLKSEGYADEAYSEYFSAPKSEGKLCSLHRVLFGGPTTKIGK
jgi:hypothetical protein